MFKKKTYFIYFALSFFRFVSPDEKDLSSYLPPDWWTMARDGAVCLYFNHVTSLTFTAPPLFVFFPISEKTFNNLFLYSNITTMLRNFGSNIFFYRLNIMVGSCLSSLFKNHFTSAKSASFAVHFVTKICQLFLSFGIVLLGIMLLGIILFGVMPFVVMSFAVMPFGIMLFGIMSFRIMSFGIKSFGIMLFGIMLFGVMLFRRYTYQTG